MQEPYQETKKTHIQDRRFSSDENSCI